MLVEGLSDKLALETLALRRGRDLAAEGVSVLPVGGAQALGRFLNLYGPGGSNVGLRRSPKMGSTSRGTIEVAHPRVPPGDVVPYPLRPGVGL